MNQIRTEREFDFVSSWTQRELMTADDIQEHKVSG